MTGNVRFLHNTVGTGPVLAMVVIILSFTCPGIVYGVQVTARVDSAQITLNDEVTFTISVEGAKSDSTPALPEMDDFHLLGAPSAYSSVQIVNGKMSSSAEYRYTLMPKKSGALTIPGVAVRVEGKIHKTSPITVTVLKSTIDATGEPAERGDLSAQDDILFISATVDRDDVYVGEQITYTLSIYTRANFTNPSFNKMPSLTGFWTKDLFSARNLTFTNRTVNGVSYKVAVVKVLALFPTSAGKTVIDPVIMQFHVTEQSQRRRRDSWDPFEDSFFFPRTKAIARQTQSIEIRVKPLPEKNKPANFTGAVGDFTILANVDKSRVKEDEPINLKVVTDGTGNLQTLTALPMPDLGNLETYTSSSSENERIDGNNLVGGKKIYEYVLIPRAAGISVIPALSFNFFNPVDESYHVLETSPIRITVDKDPLKDRFQKDAGMVVYREGVKLITRDIQFIKSDIPLSGARKPLLIRSWFIVLQVIPLCFIMAAVMVKKHRDRLKSDISYARSRYARKEAGKRLKTASEALKNGDSDMFFSEIQRALSRFIGDKFNISSTGITEDGIISMFTEKDYPGHIREKVLDIVGHCNQARFSPGEVSRELKTRIFEETKNVIYEIEKHHG